MKSLIPDETRSIDCDVEYWLYQNKKRVGEGAFELLTEMYDQIEGPEGEEMITGDIDGVSFDIYNNNEGIIALFPFTLSRSQRDDFERDTGYKLKKVEGDK